MNLCLEIIYYVQLWFLLFKKYMNRLDRLQVRATEMFKELENLPCERRWKEMVLFTLKKRQLSFQRETHQTIWIVKGKLQRWWERLHKDTPRRGGQQVQVAQEEVSSPCNKDIFLHWEWSHSVTASAAVWWSRSTEGFQAVMRLGATELHQGSLVGPGDASRSPARACCVTREGPGAGVSLLVFNVVIRSLESSEIQNGATQDQPRLLVLRRVTLKKVCCFPRGFSGRTEG